MSCGSEGVGCSLGVSVVGFLRFVGRLAPGTRRLGARGLVISSKSRCLSERGFSGGESCVEWSAVATLLSTGSVWFARSA